MKLCPHCKEPFVQKCDKLFCESHGWHGLNPAGEIIPAEAPSADELRIWELQQAKEKEPEQVIAQPIKTEPAAQITHSLTYSNQAALVLLIVAGITAAVLLGVAYYKRHRQKTGAV